MPRQVSASGAASPASVALGWRRLWPLASGLILAASFPLWNLWPCAWFALVPWLAFLRGAKPKDAFGWSWAAGFVFFLASMEWLIHVTFIGWIILCAYLALYFGVFGLIANRLLTRNQGKAGGVLAAPATAVVLAAFWVLLEYARSYALSGLGWNLLAYSQTPWIAILQGAEFAGAWSVSFLIVAVNVLLAFAGWSRGKARAAQAVGMAALLLIAAAGFGHWRQGRFPAPGATLRVAVVQGNIPQEQKWDEAYTGFILQQYTQLTQTAAADSPDLIVWPETSVPGYLGLHENLTQWVLGLARTAGRPILAGTPMVSLPRMALVNRATLVDGNGNLGQTYDKMHLVPFGEFVPFERQLSWLRAILPPIGEFEPGTKPTVFELPATDGSPSAADRRFSVLICFEDVFPDIARRFVREGARSLLVITNDAWFGPSGAAYQHAQVSTLRAVEFRVPVARAANTGWSGSIDAAGRWQGSVRDERGKELFVSGTRLCELRPGTGLTFYARMGDWFVLLCGFIALIASLLPLLPSRR